MEAGSLAIDIELTEREHSMDSHTNRFDIRVDGKQVEYHGPWGEGTRGRFDTTETSFRLTDEQLSKLRGRIERNDLQQTASEEFEMEPDGPYRSVTVDATITIDGDRHELEIDGVTSVKGTETEMEHLEQATGLENLCKQLWRWGEEAGPWWNPFTRRGWTLFSD